MNPFNISSGLRKRRKGPKKGSPNYLAIELANPDLNTGISDWVNCNTDFVGKYEVLKSEFGNGSEILRDTAVGKWYKIEKRYDKSKKGHPIIAYRLVGFQNTGKSNSIREDICEEVKKKPCVFTGTTSNIQVDHKDGRKNNPDVMNLQTQTVDDFQPVCRTLNVIKRERCKECEETGNRFDARTLNYSLAVTQGNLQYDENVGCKGCFYHDPVDFRKKISKSSL